MSQILDIHPENPQPRLLVKVVNAILQGELIVYPSGSGYAFACGLAQKKALDKIKQLRQLSDKHQFSIACAELAQVAHYAKMPNPVFRYIKPLVPGPYTFILNAAGQLPKKIMQPKRKTIGIQLPCEPIIHQLVSILDGPVITSSCLLPDDEWAPTTIYEVESRFNTKLIDLIIDGGEVGHEPTTVIDLTTEEPEILRHGRGAI